MAIDFSVLAEPPLAAAARRRQSNLQVVWALAGVATILLLGYPIVAFASAAFLLINLPDYVPARARLLLGFIVMASVSLMMSSRPVGTTESQDIVGYYDIYLEIYNGDYQRFSQFGGGIEIGLTSLYVLWSFLLPKLSLNGLMMCMSLTSSVLFLCWVEVALYADPRARGVVLMGAALLLFNIYFSTQLVRQFMALIILLYAFTGRTLIRRLLWLALACTFHLTALPFYLVYLMGRRGRYGIFAIAACAVLLRVYFGQIVAAFDLLPQTVAEKTLYYVDSAGGYTVSDLGSFRMIAILCTVSLTVLLTSGGKLHRDERRWHAIPWVTALLHIVLLPIPLAPLRATLLVHSILPGVLLYLMVSQRRRSLLVIFLNLLLLNKIAAYGGLEGGAGLISTLGALIGFVA